MKPADSLVYCLPQVPHQNGSLWVEVTPDRQVKVLDPAGKWWRGRTFTVEEFNKIVTKSTT